MDLGKIAEIVVDKEQLPPLNQKRLLAFINHFVISTCNFLNTFAARCEGRFIELERKLQQIEATLIILEAKLDPIPVINNSQQIENVEISNQEVDGNCKAIDDKSNIKTESTMVDKPGQYTKFYKMLHVGVPAEAIKLRMQAEGINPDILDNPDTATACKEECQNA